MKLVLYNDFQLGVLQGDTVVPVGNSVADLGASQRSRNDADDHY